MKKQKWAKKLKKIKAGTIILNPSVYVCESVNLDDGDAASAESPFLFLKTFPPKFSQ